MVCIPLVGKYSISTDGVQRFALIDDIDVDQAQHVWKAVKGHKGVFYAERNVVVDGKRVHLRLHQIIAERMGIGRRPDHIDYDGLNNCRDNLRRATASQQSIHRRKFANNTSNETGLHWYKRTSRWLAFVDKGGKRYKKYFKQREEALAWRKAKKAELYGEFACEAA